MTIGTKSVLVSMWDTAGQEKYNSVTQSFYRNVDAVLIAYDCSSYKTFENIPNWMKQINSYAPEGVLKVIVANKVDLDHKEVSSKEGQELASELGCLYYEASAKTGTNVDVLFKFVTEQIVSIKEKQPELLEGRVTNPRVKVCFTHRKKRRLCKWMQYFTFAG